MINVPTIAILDTSEKYLGKIDNSIVNTLHIGKEKLTTYVTGAASLFEFSVLNKGYQEYAYLVIGNKLTFVYKGRNYYLTIMRVEENEVGKTILAMSTSLEQTVEQTEPYKASSAHPMSYYVGIFDPEKTITIGINQVASKTLTLEWEGQESRLARLLSLANKFDAEIEFVYELRNDHSLGKLVMNIYEKYSDGKGGMGQVRNDVKLRYGVDVKTISKTVDGQELYTAIRPYGTDGLTIKDVEIAEYDSEGRLLYFSEKGSDNILAPQARDAYPSNLLGRNHDKYLALPWDYDTKNVNVLAGQALAKLKQISVPKAEYVIEGYFDLNLGDVVQIEDNGFTPTLLLSARVSEQVISWTEPQNNQTTFSNVVEQESQVSDDLLARVEALIDANKVYTGVITSTNGIVFKNNLGTTDLTAVVRDSSIDVTGNFSITWYKDGTEIAQANTITVTADDVLQKAVYKFEAKDSEGNVKAVAEVTVSDVSDGERGEDGVGVASTKVEYQASTSGTTPPTGTWVGNPPAVSEGQYLWTRTTFTYTDSSTTLAYSISRMGADGEGVGIADVTITYQAGSSGTTPPTGTWSSTIPSVAANQFLWTRTVTTYTDGATSTAYSVGKMGANGADAQLLYLSASANVMKFDSNDIVVPSQSITLTAKLQNASGTATWTAIPYIGSTAQTPITLAGSGNTRTLASGNWTNAAWTSVAITATLGSLTDTLSIVKVADGAAAFVHRAWKMPDGTFTKVYPNENLLNARLVAPISNNGAAYPITNEVLVEDGVQFTRTRRTNPTSSSSAFSIFTVIDISGFSASLAGKRVGLSNIVRASSPVNMTLMARYVSAGGSGPFPNEADRVVDVRTAWKQVTFVVESFPSNVDVIRFNPLSIVNPVPDLANFYLDMRDWKVEILDEGEEPTIFTTQPAADPANAFPKWEGSYSDNLETSSDNPDDYEPWAVIRGEDGADGVAGKDGLGVSSTTITYAQSTSGTTAPTTGWTAQVPTLVKGQYLWTRTVWTYTDNSTETGYTVSYNAKDGNNGTDGIAGKDGVGISSTVVEYVASASGTVKPTTGWSTTIPTVPQGQYLWTRTTWTYTDSTSEQGFSVARQGANGTNGTNGADGADGKDAQEVFSGYLTNESIVLPANAAGTVTDFSKANGTFVTFIGQNQLSTGVAYSLESATGITTTINATSGAYSVTAISADVGVAIYKAVYSGVTIRKQLMVVKARQGATGTNGTNGADGKDGVGVTNTVITYQAGSSGTTAPTGTWTSTIPSVSASQYLWTRTVWTFSDGTSKTGYSIGKMGDNGAKGDTGATGATGATGNGIASAAITYANSASGTTVPTSGWVTTIPSVPAGNFLWTRTIFTYTNGNTNTSYAVAKQGEKGDPTGIVTQNTVPAAADRYVGMLWKNTGASGYINGATYRWNGSAFELYIFIAENISVSNLAAISANLGTITAGTINGVTINGSTFVNTFSYTEGGVTYTGTTTMSGGNVIISRTGSNGSTWTTKVDRTLGFEDSYKAGSTAPARTTRLGQGQLYMAESGVGGYLPASALNPTSWTNLTYASGFTTAENNPCQYRMFPQLDGSTLIKFRGQFQLTDGGNFTTSSNLRPFGDGGIPAHIRPSKTEFAQGSSNRASGGRLAVTGAGNFFYNAETADQTYCSISAISYYI